jgi:hypothetical protein
VAGGIGDLVRKEHIHRDLARAAREGHG